MNRIEFLRSSNVKRFIKEHAGSDIQKLLLNPPVEFKESIKTIVDQIRSRQKAIGKLASWATDFELILPPPLSIEQASSEKTATYKKSIVSGTHLIDLSGGMGVDCLTLSENFVCTTYVEMQTEVAEAFRYNSQILGKKIDVRNLTAQDFIDRHGGKRTEKTVLYLDPARRDEAQDKVFQLEDCSPNILQLLPSFKECANIVLIKLSPLVDIKSLLNRLSSVREVHVVSVKNECKEVLVLIDFSMDSEPLIKTVNIGLQSEKFEFTFPEEENTESTFSDVSKFLFEPNASILKAGAFRKVGVDFRVNKVHVNTHLYTSDQKPAIWPGRTFEILEQKVDKNLLKKYAPNGHVNVLVRNYPLSAKELKKKYKMQDGGEFFLIGFRDKNEKAKLVIARKVVDP